MTSIERNQSMKLDVLRTQWAAEDTVFQGGVHELSSDECPCGLTHGKPDADLLRLIAGAEAAGSIVVVDASDAHRAKLDKAVQSQEDGEAAYKAAQPVYDLTTGAILEDGPWREGNLLQHALDAANPDAPKAAVA